MRARPAHKDKVFNMVFFFGKEDILSHWHPAKFKVNNVEFNCVEQFFMYCKAKYFKDDVTADLILKETDPFKQKQWGRAVANYDDDEWSLVRENYMLKGNYAKFTQNPDLQQYLVSTHPDLIVEASPTDRFWGVGLSRDDPDIVDPKKWRGLNKAGLGLGKLREFFIMLEHGELTDDNIDN